MLNQLIELTNNEDFWGNWHLRLEGAQFRQGTLEFIVSTIMDDYPPAENTLKWWLINCEKMTTENGIGTLNLPNYRINLYDEHPFLWNYEKRVNLLLTGKVQSLSQLLGDLFLSHIKVCGNWLNFNNMVAGIHWRLQQEGKAEMLIPERMIKIFEPILTQHGLKITMQQGLNATPGLKMLLIGNPHISPDDYQFGQAYVIAENFSAKAVAPNTGFSALLAEE